jgi:hypothetical protein
LREERDIFFLRYIAHWGMFDREHWLLETPENIFKINEENINFISAKFVSEFPNPNQSLSDNNVKTKTSFVIGRVHRQLFLN